MCVCWMSVIIAMCIAASILHCKIKTMHYRILSLSSVHEEQNILDLNPARCTRAIVNILRDANVYLNLFGW